MRLCSRLVPRSIVGVPVAFVSCVSSTFFQPARSGSHLYTANRNTLRSVHRVEDLLALVGTHLSWSPHPPLLCFHYTTLCGICQALFLKISKSYIFPRRYLDRTSWFSGVVFLLPLGWLCSVHPRRSRLLPQLCHSSASLVYYLYSGEVGCPYPFGVASGDFTGLTTPLAICSQPTCGE